MTAKKKKQQTDRILIPAVIYARYSSSGQRDESIEGQIRECTEYAERNGFQIIETYTDKALTGRSDKRPGFQQMIADSDKQIFKAVICWKTDRFARNRYDAATYKYRLRKNGVRLFYARETVPDGPEGIILESVMEGFAEYYSANLGENVKRGNYDSALQFKTLGKKLLGFRRSASDQYEKDPETAPIVFRIFQEYDAGRTMVQIADDLNREGFRNINGGKFNIDALRRILRNEKYIGVYKFKDIRAENVIPALVDRDLFDRVQLRLSRRKHSPRARDDTRFLLTSKLFCGHCGSPMTGDSATGEHGQKYYYYTCNMRRRHKCKKKRVRKDSIEEFILKELTRIIMDDDFCTFLADKCIEMINRSSADRTAENALKARLSDVNKRIANTINAIQLGIVTQSVTESLQKLETERDELSAALAQEQLQKPAIDREMILFALDQLRIGDVTDQMFQERLIETFLNSVYLYDDGKCIMHLNFTGDNDTVDLQMNEIIAESSNRDAEVQPDEVKTNWITGVPGIVSVSLSFR